MDVPINVAAQYGHRFSTISPDNKAGANERAGFTDAQDIHAKKSMSKPTIPTITMPPKPPKPIVCANTRFTGISKSKAHDLLMSGKERFRAVLTTGH
jgi:hypothetical protein